MPQRVTDKSQTRHKSLNGEWTIFPHVTTRHINPLYKVRIYFTLIKKCDVLRRVQIHYIHH